MKKYLSIIALTIPSLLFAGPICDLKVTQQPSGLSKNLPSISEETDEQYLPTSLIEGMETCFTMVRANQLRVTCFDDREGGYILEVPINPKDVKLSISLRIIGAGQTRQFSGKKLILNASCNREK